MNLAREAVIEIIPPWAKETESLDQGKKYRRANTRLARKYGLEHVSKESSLVLEALDKEAAIGRKALLALPLALAAISPSKAEAGDKPSTKPKKELVSRTVYEKEVSSPTNTGRPLKQNPVAGKPRSEWTSKDKNAFRMWSMDRNHPTRRYAD